MELYCKEKDYTLYEGKMQDVLSSMPDNSVDSIITDPPYEISFMGKGWDATGVAYTKETWEHCFRVLKPGGYLLSFGATRTFHRIAVAIEDAGFEIRDTIMWLYGSGFPKSLNLGKALDRKNGVDNIHHKGKWNFEHGNMEEFWKRKKEYKKEEDKPLETELAKKWQGWGTALKPAYEPIIVARKPFKGSLVDNVLEYGVGGINIDECRVETIDILKEQNNGKNSLFGGIREYNFNGDKYIPNEQGRFPANVILTYDETDFDEVCGGMPDTKSSTTTTMPNLSDKNAESGIYSKINAERIEHLGGFNDSGSASRYFYCAKASKKDRDEGLDLFEEKQTTDGCIRSNSETARTFGANSSLRKNIHPTVKPVELMQYLVRLVTPKNGVVLDCFMGSGSTGKAVMFENRERNANYHFIGIEMTSEYLPICHSRIDYALNKYEYDLEKEKQEMEQIGQISLF